MLPTLNLIIMKKLILLFLIFIVLGISVKAYKKPTVRKPKAVLCSTCTTHYNTECEGEGDGCDPTDCPYQ